MKFKAFAIIPHPGEIEIRPLVLCKECRYYDGEGTCMKIGIAMLTGNWFCADGEKGEDDG